MKIIKLTGKILIWLVALMLSLALLFVGGLNIAKFFIYDEYYSIKENITKNPGLSDGFVCQGIAAEEEAEIILVSGYMMDGERSRIYLTDLQGNSRYVTLTREGKDFTGHAGGIAVSHGTVYIASGKKIYTLPLSSLLDSKSGESIDIGSGTRVNNSASFVYTDEEYLYVGEFHDGGKYVTEHIYETPEGENHAIVSRYSLSDLSAPDRIYSVRGKVQGICFTPDGKIVMSTSYGIADTVYYVYNTEDAYYSGYTLDGAPVYYMGELQNEIKAPAMGEDLDYFNGMVISLTESASDKYKFGKLFFANKIFGLKI